MAGNVITPVEAKVWVAEGIASGRLQEVEITCIDGAPRKVVVWPATLETLANLPDPWPRMRVLSPFDPALRDRARAERLFGFHYRIEIFVPEPKRQYGYYVFPLMEGDRMVGRVDMSTSSASDTLKVAALWPERGVKWGKGRQTRFEAELDRVRRLACCERVTFADDWLRDPK